MALICKLFCQNYETREGIITATSCLGIIINIILAIIKIIIGIMSSSIAIISEGANGAADALSSFLTLIGTKLAKMHPDEKHPFGYGRIEYLIGLVISITILVTGIEMLISSVKYIFYPEALNVSYLIIIIVACSAIIKFFLGVFTIKIGEKTESSALIGVGIECRNDAFASVITVISSFLYLFGNVSIDAYAGIFISTLIIKSGVDVLRDSIADLIGRPGKRELAQQLYKEIRQTEGIVSAADMMLHNYGPDYWSGSVNVELDHKKNVGDVYRLLHALQLRIMKEHHVVMVFGVYAVDNDNQEAKELREKLKCFVEQNEYVKSFHAVYIDSIKHEIYCDIVVDYKLKDWDALRQDAMQQIGQDYPGYLINLTIETEYV